MAILHRFDERDRALFNRLRFVRTTKPVWRSLALVLTHLGGARATILLVIVPMFSPRSESAGLHGLYTLALSHVLVQIVKRTVGRPRPSRSDDDVALIHEPDRFSFPSGHAAAAISLALAWSGAVPQLAIPLFVLAGVVGATRVLLGVHYPGDVAVGQGIAVGTHWLLIATGS
ncbi:MAG: phosphatase PAP2 family protein [Gemmatimonadota bacterium]